MVRQKIGKSIKKEGNRFAAVLLAGAMVFSGIVTSPAAAYADVVPSGSGGANDMNASAVSWVMTQEGNYWQKQPDLITTEWVEEDKSELYIDVDETVTYQQMAQNVWGGCFNERGWKYLNELSEEDRNHILDLLFDPDEEDGLHITLGRIPIGASDFAIDLYTLDDEPNDYGLEHFSIERDKSETGIIPYIKEALKRQPNMRFWASPWSPPAWIKDNNNLIAGNIVYNEQNMTFYANYFKKFVEAYEAEGIHISMVSPQNEPTMWTAYTSCIWTGEQLRDFVRDYLGPEMEKLGVEIYLGTFTDSKDKLMDPTLNDPDAKNYISGITFQWWSYLKAHSLYNSGFDLGMMQSETMCGDGNNNWAYAENQFDLMWMYLESGISAYNLWNMVLEWDGVNPGGHNTAENPWPQNAPITVNETTKEYTINPHYYEFKHFTDYIKPGARRIASTGTYDAAFPLKDGEGDDKYAQALHEIAFRNPDGSNVLMVKNGSNETKHVDINFNGRGVSVDLPAHSIHTFQTSGTPLTGNETDMRGGILEEEIVRLENKGTGQSLCVQGEGGVVNDLSPVFQWAYGGEANQQWYLLPSEVDGAATVKIINIKSGKPVSVDGGGTNAGAPLILWHDTGEVSQNWILEDAKDGYVRIKNANSNLYLAGQATVQPVQWHYDANDDTQVWKVIHIADETVPTKKELDAFNTCMDEARNLDEAGYTPESYEAVQTALQEAERAVVTNRGGLLPAKRNLERALRGLVEVICTVIFDADDGSIGTTVTVRRGQKIKAPQKPWKEGYTFAGWYEADAEAAFDFNTVIMADTVLTARWTEGGEEPPEKEKYTVIFRADNGSADVTVQVEEGQKVSEPETPSKEGYTFAGWYEADAKTAFDFNAAVTKDITLTARWTKNEEKPPVEGNPPVKEDPPAAKTSISLADVKVAKAEYNGKAQKPKVTVTYNGSALLANVDYKVSYSSNVKIGQGKALLTGIGKFNGKKTVAFTIQPKKVKITKISNSASKKLTVKFSKSKGAKGYEISFATNKRFKKANKLKVKKTAGTLKKLKKSKTYYVRVRPYAKVKGGTVYGDYSNTVKKKIKK